MLRKKKQRSSK